ncbi:hypothetical protein GF362_04305 [Candidatus Dojkabacteria bacterium]|nr:hypothetical protein [Candidatus Dojkabacteria bacterium]
MPRKKVGLALGSGGTRGISHIGVIKSLVENNIPIDYISGTSIGAVVGGAYACLGDIYEVEKICLEFNFREFIEAFTDPTIRSGIFKGDRVIQLLTKYIGDAEIQDLNIPFRAVAADLVSGEIFEFDKGDLASAIRASSSVPFLFKPFEKQKKFLIDGGAAEPVPARTAREMGADYVIAVNLDSVFFPLKKNLKDGRTHSSLSILRRTLELFRYHLAEENVKVADIVIEPNVPDQRLIRLIHKRRIRKVIKKGEKVTKKKIRQIKRDIYGDN